MPLAQRREGAREPICWSSDEPTVLKILDFCERSYRSKASGRYEEARNEILERIYGNLLNSNRFGYPSEISFDTVARELTKFCDDTPAGQAKRAGYIAALESEWERTRNDFKSRRFSPRS